MEWMLLPLKRYADFSGRSRRKEYWMFTLFSIILDVILAIIDGVIDSDPNSIGILSTIKLVIFIVPTIAVGVRRMHDTDHSGWWIIVPIANLIFAVTDGDSGSNRFGRDPKIDIDEEIGEIFS